MEAPPISADSVCSITSPGERKKLGRVSPRRVNLAGELMQKYPETTKRFLAAQILGMQLARNNKQEAIKAGYDAGLRGDPDIVSRAYDLYSRGFTADLSVAEEGIQTMLEEGIRAGIVDKKMTVSRVIDQRLLKLAHQELRTEGKLRP